MTATAAIQPSLRRRLAGQGALLLGGFALAHALSFARNAVLAYWLSKGDFGIAATLMLALQLLDVASDLGADRLIVGSDDGDDPGLMAAAHAALVARGMLGAGLLYVCAGPVADFFRIEAARWAFEMAALVPLLKGFLHLDSRRKQRSLENGSFLLVEVAPQAAALCLAVPALALAPEYSAVVWLAVVQAALAVGTSHAVADRRYELSFAGPHWRRLIAFGWPIWLSALPLIATYYGDRALIGRVFGMEALAGYSAAFTITMAPGLIAAKVGHALMLPLLAETRHDGAAFARRVRLSSDVTAAIAALYACLFIVAGGDLLPVAFGPNYLGLGAVIAWLGVMWALRMIQAVPGMALMAIGDTRPLLTAGVLRACALLPAFALAMSGAGVAAIAAAGAAGEVLSLFYVALRLDRDQRGLAAVVLSRALFLVLACSAAGCLLTLLPPGAGLLVSLPAAVMLSMAIALAATALVPSIRVSLKLLPRPKGGRTPMRQRLGTLTGAATPGLPRTRRARS